MYMDQIRIEYSKSAGLNSAQMESKRTVRGPLSMKAVFGTFPLIPFPITSICTMRNGLQLKDDVTGQLGVAPRKHTRGVAPPKNEVHIDHVKPKSAGGANSASNAHVRLREGNLKKGARQN